MAGSSSTIPNAAELDQPLFLINLSYCRTLTPLTYLTWASQITSIFTNPAVAESNNEPAKPAPTASVPNPTAITWCRQDRLILGALVGTLNPAVAPLVHQAATSHEAWTTLKTTYTNPSRGHILRIKDNLANLTKNQLSISDYMNAVISYTDKLAILGKPMDPEDIIYAILKGLDYETFKPIIDSTRARDNLISFETLHEKLIQPDIVEM